MRTITLRLISTVSVLTTYLAWGVPLNVGVLEFGVKDDNFQKPAEPFVRAAFQKSEKEWRACTAATCPASAKWNIFYDGKSIGEVDTGPQPSEPGRLAITSDRTKLPKKEARASEFNNWTGTSKYRPLVVAIGAQPADPDQWKKADLSPEFQKQVREEYRKKFPSLTNCDANGEFVKNFHLKDKDFTFPTVFKSKANAYLIKLRPKGYRCDGPAEEEWSDHLFYRSATGAVKHLGGELTPMDAADFDGDGKSEWMVWYAAYNEDGYWLFYNDFTKSVKLTWSYH